MKMCRPKFLPSEKRVTRLKNVFDLNFYRQLVTQNPQEILTEKIVANDIDMSDYARFYMVTGANNGGNHFRKSGGSMSFNGTNGIVRSCGKCRDFPCRLHIHPFSKGRSCRNKFKPIYHGNQGAEKICEYMTDRSLVIFNESIQSTTPVECLNIAKIHLEIIAAVGVRGFYVTHLTELYNEIQRINNKNYPTKVGSLVSCTDSEGKRMYKMKAAKPPIESLAYTVYENSEQSLKTYLQSRVIRMDKRENLLQFLDYGGNELFSSLMESDSDRPQALDRMCILLRKAVIFGKLKGRAAAYQYMISKANQMGFIKSKKYMPTG